MEGVPRFIRVFFDTVLFTGGGLRKYRTNDQEPRLYPPAVSFVVTPQHVSYRII